MTLAAGSSEEVAPGAVISLEVDGQPVAVANVGGILYAFDDHCTHRQCLLSEGRLDGAVVTCGCHGSQFDVTTGAVLKGPARLPLSTFRVEIVNGELLVGALDQLDAAHEAPAAVPTEAPATLPAEAPAPRAEQAPRTAALEDPLAQMPLFQGLDAAVLQTLHALTFRRTFKPGDVIVDEGRTGNGGYVIVSGRVEVVRGLPDRPQVLATFGPGEPFGEMALILDLKRTASVVAIEETTCIGIDRWVFLAFLRREPELAVRMLQFMTQRLVETNRLLGANV